MAAWALGLQLGIGLLTTLQPEIEASLAEAVASGQDASAHQAAQVAVADAIESITGALALARPQS